jgi:hypothetical protein
VFVLFFLCGSLALIADGVLGPSKFQWSRISLWRAGDDPQAPCVHALFSARRFYALTIVLLSLLAEIVIMVMISSAHTTVFPHTLFDVTTRQVVWIGGMLV